MISRLALKLIACDSTNVVHNALSRILLDNAAQYSTMLDNFAQCSTMLENEAECCTNVAESFQLQSLCPVSSSFLLKSMLSFKDFPRQMFQETTHLISKV